MSTKINTLRFTDQIQWDAEDSQTFGKRTASGTDAPGSESSFAQGTGAGQVDVVYLTRQTLAASASLVLDLAGGGLLDLLGNAANFARVKGVYVRQVASSGNTATNILVGQAASNSAVTWQVPVRLGGVLKMWSPDATGLFAVTAGTGDQFRVENADAVNPADFFLAIVGASA